MKRTILALALLAVGASAAGGSCNTMDMVDNYRVPQPTNAGERTIYRTHYASSECGHNEPSSTADKEDTTATTYAADTTTNAHWTYADQGGWSNYKTPNECGATHALNVPGATRSSSGPYQDPLAFAGESPINIVPSETTEAPTNLMINLNGVGKTRSGMPIFNNGHTIGYSICPSKLDCSLTADFGTWPKKLRGITNDNNADEYFLLQMHWHWGSDNTKGSEHQICGKPRAAELHLVWVNKRNITTDRSDAESSLLLAVTGIMIEGGAAEDNPAFSSMVDSVAKKAPGPGDGGTGVQINVKDLLPDSWASKFYTYPGSLTTPPCSQVVSWFVFENFVKLSDAQLNKLRHAQMGSVLTPEVETMKKKEKSNDLSGPVIGLICIAVAIGIIGFGFACHFLGSSRESKGDERANGAGL